MSTSGFHAENVLTAGMLLLPVQKEEIPRQTLFVEVFLMSSALLCGGS
jgi:hypothetical protein